MCRIGGRGRCCVSDVAGRDVAGRDVADRDVAGRDVADRDVADRDVAGRDVAGRRLWPIVACRALPTGSRGPVLPTGDRGPVLPTGSRAPVLHAGCCGLRSAAGLRCEGGEEWLRLSRVLRRRNAGHAIAFMVCSSGKLLAWRWEIGFPNCVLRWGIPTLKSVHGGWRAIGWGLYTRKLWRTQKLRNPVWRSSRRNL